MANKSIEARRSKSGDYSTKNMTIDFKKEVGSILARLENLQEFKPGPRIPIYNHPFNKDDVRKSLMQSYLQKKAPSITSTPFLPKSSKGVHALDWSSDLSPIEKESNDEIHSKKNNYVIEISDDEDSLCPNVNYVNQIKRELSAEQVELSKKGENSLQSSARTNSSKLANGMRNGLLENCLEVTSTKDISKNPVGVEENIEVEVLHNSKPAHCPRSVSGTLYRENTNVSTHHSPTLRSFKEKENNACSANNNMENVSEIVNKSRTSSRANGILNEINKEQHISMRKKSPQPPKESSICNRSRDSPANYTHKNMGTSSFRKTTKECGEEIFNEIMKKLTPYLKNNVNGICRSVQTSNCVNEEFNGDSITSVAEATKKYHRSVHNASNKNKSIQTSNLSGKNNLHQKNVVTNATDLLHNASNRNKSIQTSNLSEKNNLHQKNLVSNAADLLHNASNRNRSIQTSNFSEKNNLHQKNVVNNSADLLRLKNSSVKLKKTRVEELEEESLASFMSSESSSLHTYDFDPYLFESLKRVGSNRYEKYWYTDHNLPDADNAGSGRWRITGSPHPLASIESKETFMPFDAQNEIDESNRTLTPKQVANGNKISLSARKFRRKKSVCFNVSSNKHITPKSKFVNRVDSALESNSPKSSARKTKMYNGIVRVQTPMKRKSDSAVQEELTPHKSFLSSLGPQSIALSRKAAKLINSAKKNSLILISPSNSFLAICNNSDSNHLEVNQLVHVEDQVEMDINNREQTMQGKERKSTPKNREKTPVAHSSHKTEISKQRNCHENVPSSRQTLHFEDEDSLLTKENSEKVSDEMATSKIEEKNNFGTKLDYTHSNSVRKRDDEGEVDIIDNDSQANKVIPEKKEQKIEKIKGKSRKGKNVKLSMEVLQEVDSGQSVTTGRPQRSRKAPVLRTDQYYANIFNIDICQSSNVCKSEKLYSKRMSKTYKKQSLTAKNSSIENSKRKTTNTRYTRAAPSKIQSDVISENEQPLSCQESIVLSKVKRGRVSKKTINTKSSKKSIQEHIERHLSNEEQETAEQQESTLTEMLANMSDESNILAQKEHSPLKNVALEDEISREKLGQKRQTKSDRSSVVSRQQSPGKYSISTEELPNEDKESHVPLYERNVILENVDTESQISSTRPDQVDEDFNMPDSNRLENSSPLYLALRDSQDDIILKTSKRVATRLSFNSDSDKNMNDVPNPNTIEFTMTDADEKDSGKYSMSQLTETETAISKLLIRTRTRPNGKINNKSCTVRQSINIKEGICVIPFVNEGLNESGTAFSGVNLEHNDFCSKYYVKIAPKKKYTSLSTMLMEYIITEGSARIELSDKKVDLRKEDIFYIYPGSEYSIFNPCAENLLMICKTLLDVSDIFV